jgi:hypothetical protein
MTNLTETFLINEALLAIAAPDFPLMREEWAAEDAYAAAEEAYWNRILEKELDEYYEREYDRQMNRYMYPELS